MKKQIVFKPGQIFWIICMAALPLLGACQKENEMGGEGMIPLSEIPDNPDYLNLPLIGTAWKLVGFADEKTETIKLVEPSEGNRYVLVFENNGRFSGISSTNEIEGEFDVNISENVLKIERLGGTKVNETSCGKQYMSFLSLTERYETTERGLLLFNNSTTYLLYHPIARSW